MQQFVKRDRPVPVWCSQRSNKIRNTVDRVETNSVYINRCGVVSGLGDTLDETWAAILSGGCAIAEITRFNTAEIAYHQASVAPIHEKSSHTAALIDAAVHQLGPVPEDTAVIWTGSKNDIEYIELGLKEGFPHFSSYFRRRISANLGLAEDGCEVNAACASATVGLALGAQKIRNRSANHVLVCGADILSRFVHFGFSALKALSPTVCRPFDSGRDGLCLGEGAYAILLSGNPGRTDPVRITGWSVTNDANHITGPARDGCGLIDAVHTALSMSSIPTDAVDAWCAHGTGTVYNDAMELTALESVFGDRRFPLFSIKGAIGHTLGAAGGIEAAVCVEALRSENVPPTAGLTLPEPRAEGRVSEHMQPFAGRTVLTTNSGFGGVNAALILER